MAEPPGGFQVHNPGGRFRVVVTKVLPGRRWLEVLTSAGCEAAVATSREALSPAVIRAGLGRRADGAIGQLTEPGGAELFEALKAAGGRACSNYAVGYDNGAVPVATGRSIR